ncbi:hypothetical protein QUB12_23925 [Microcoleus sp. B7-D4]
MRLQKPGFYEYFSFLGAKLVETGFLAPRESALKLSEVLINYDLLIRFFGKNEPRRREGREEREGREFRLKAGIGG